jgi:hypothetical protein
LGKIGNGAWEVVDNFAMKLVAENAIRNSQLNSLENNFQVNSLYGNFDFFKRVKNVQLGQAYR